MANYKISKRAHDARTHTCGLWIMDGYVLVVGLSFDNMKQIENIRKFGYLVEETEEPQGCYREDGRKVVYDSIHRFCTGLGPLEFEDGGEIESNPPEEIVKKQTDTVQNDLALLRAKLDAKGVEYSKHEKGSSLLKKLNNAEQATG